MAACVAGQAIMTLRGFQDRTLTGKTGNRLESLLMEYKDYYKILGVERSAPQDEIKRAYRKLARKYHPDINKETGAEAKFKEIGEAYEVLKDPEKRAAYDQLGSQWQGGQDFRPPPGWESQFEFGGAGFSGREFGGAGFGGMGEEHSDFFESLFGQAFGGAAGRRPRQPFGERTRDHHVKLTIDLDDSFHGATRQVTLSVPDVDESGRRRQATRTLNVKIPKGIKAGQNIRLSGQGASGPGGTAGDLYLEVEFKSHPLYKVEGRDLYIDLPLTPWEAALGSTVKLPTPDGTVDVKIPAGSKTGGKLRLKGRGIPSSPPGDLFAVLTIVLPPANTESAKQAYRRLAEDLPFNPRAKWGV
jgi:curved DNA-binding protein